MTDLVSEEVRLSNRAEHVCSEEGGSDVQHLVAHHLAHDVAHTVHVVAHSWDDAGHKHQVLPVWFLVTRDTHHVTVTAAVSLQIQSHFIKIDIR